MYFSVGITLAFAVCMNALHLRALEIVSRYSRVEAELLDILIQIERAKAYRQLGCNSLFVYATCELKLSESVAYAFISVARKSMTVPTLKTEIERGGLSVSKASRVVSVITPANDAEWITKAKTLPKAQSLNVRSLRLIPKPQRLSRRAILRHSDLVCSLGSLKRPFRN